MTRSSLFVMALIGVGFVGARSSAEEPVERGDLPPAVEKTIAEETRGATIQGFSREVEGGEVRYEVEMVVEGRHRDLLLDDQGSVLEVEDEVSLAALPEAVREGLRVAAGSGRIAQVESLSRKGRVVSYEAIVERGTERIEIQVDPDGKPLGQPQ